MALIAWTAFILGVVSTILVVSGGIMVSSIVKYRRSKREVE